MALIGPNPINRPPRAIRNYPLLNPQSAIRNQQSLPAVLLLTRKAVVCDDGGVMETSLHRCLKSHYAQAGAKYEERLGQYRIDVHNGDELVEIQHGS